MEEIFSITSHLPNCTLLEQGYSKNCFKAFLYFILQQLWYAGMDLNEARDDGGFEMHWYQLDHMQTICTSLQTDKDTHKHLIAQFFTGQMLFLTPSQQC